MLLKQPFFSAVLAQLIFGIPIEALPVAGLVVISLVVRHINAYVDM